MPQRGLGSALAVSLRRSANIPSAHLVAFVQLALQGIGFTGKDGQPYSDETISDHLNERIGGGGARRRHSGAKRSTMHP